MPEKSFRTRVQELRPDVVREIEGNETKRKLALALRALRRKVGMTQKDVERKAGLSQPVISRLESPTGPSPNWDTVMRYIEACNGHMLFGLSTQSFDEAAFIASKKCVSDGVVAAVTV